MAQARLYLCLVALFIFNLSSQVWGFSISQNLLARGRQFHVRKHTILRCTSTESSASTPELSSESEILGVKKLAEILEQRYFPGERKAFLQDVVSSLFKVIDEEVMTKGNRIIIRYFGSFSLCERKARLGRNPKSGKAINIPAKLSMKFSPSDNLRVSIPNDEPNDTGDDK